jgi:ornithine--oxo-acid transaminase
MQLMTPAIVSDLYQEYVNPQWAKLLELLDMNVQYDRCEGVELHAADGRTILDFLSGYGVHNAGHNHPRIIAALKQELDRRGPAMLQSHVPNMAGELAARLSKLAGGDLQKVFFAAQAARVWRRRSSSRGRARGAPDCFRRAARFMD